MVVDAEKGYVAGLLDGEGAIFLQKARTSTKGKWMQPMVDISNNDENCLRYIQGMYGGFVSTVGRGHHLRLWESVKIKRLLEDVFPYLIVKREQAKILLAYIESRSHRKGRPYTANELAWYKALRVLNSGVGQEVPQ